MRLLEKLGMGRGAGRRASLGPGHPSPFYKNIGPRLCPLPVRKKPTRPNQCRRAFLLRAAKGDRSILESLFSTMGMVGRGRAEGVDPAHSEEPGGREFLSGLRSAVAARQLSPSPEGPAVWVWSSQDCWPACFKACPGDCPGWRVQTA